jgi:hypothetical protein
MYACAIISTPKKHFVNFRMKKFLPWLIYCVVALPGCNSIYVPASPAVPVFTSAQQMDINFNAGGCGFNANVSCPAHRAFGQIEFQESILLNRSAYFATAAHSLRRSVLFSAIFRL